MCAPSYALKVVWMACMLSPLIKMKLRHVCEDAYTYIMQLRVCDKVTTNLYTLFLSGWSDTSSTSSEEEKYYYSQRTIRS